MYQPWLLVHSATVDPETSLVDRYFLHTLLDNNIQLLEGQIHLSLQCAWLWGCLQNSGNGLVLSAVMLVLEQAYEEQRSVQYFKPNQWSCFAGTFKLKLIHWLAWVFIDTVEPIIITTCIIIEVWKIWKVIWQTSAQVIDLSGSALNDASLSAVVLENVQYHSCCSHIILVLIMFDAVSSRDRHLFDFFSARKESPVMYQSYFSL